MLEFLLQIASGLIGIVSLSFGRLGENMPRSDDTTMEFAAQ